VLQGIGAAMLSPQALVLISAIFPAERRGAAFGVFTAVAGIAAVSGPTLGGLLVTELGWQSVFYLNLPVGVAGIVLAVRMVPDLRPGRRHRFDVVGVLLATTILLGVVYGLVEGQRRQWNAQIVLILAGAAVLLVLFLLWEKRQPEPLIPLALYRDRDYSIATILTLIVSFSLSGFLLVYVIETQTLLGMSPLASGVSGLPWTLSLSAVAPLAGRLADRVGGRILLITGLAVYAAGVLGIALLSTTSATAATFVAPLVAIGVGQGLAIAPATTEAMRGIAPERAGAASGVLNTARHVGTALGAAIVGVLLQNNRTLAGFDRATIVIAAVILLGSALALLMSRKRAAHTPERRPIRTGAQV
jgi:EmrB/QacA subfamily drug resistance transporter